MVPLHAMMTVLYDISCILDRSVQMFDILPPHILPWILFVTTAMHAYGHQWACQLMYNPRLCHGLGLTDGEGIERMWAHLRKLISIVRMSSHAHQLWLTDHQLSAIALELKDDLGDWLQRQQRCGMQEQSRKAKAIIEKSGMMEAELHAQWELQKSAQISVRAHKSNHTLHYHVIIDLFIDAPSCMKKELEAILSLQTDLEAVEKAKNTAKTMLAASSAPDESKKILTALEEFNAYCAKLTNAHDPSWNVPLPIPLPTKLADLQDNPGLMEDIWVLSSDMTPQPWLDDPDIRAGIHAVLKLDCCTEELCRLGHEADNLCSWFGQELQAVELAMCMPNSSNLGHASACPDNPPCVNNLDEDPDMVLDLSLHEEPSNEDEVSGMMVSEILEEDKEDINDTSCMDYIEDAIMLQWAALPLKEDKGKNPWIRDLKNISIFITRILELAKHLGYPVAASMTGWRARPMVLSTLSSTQMLSSATASSDFVLAHWRYAQCAALFYHQAKSRGELQPYFDLVEDMYHHPWNWLKDTSKESMVDLKKKVQAAALGTVNANPKVHWRQGLTMDNLQLYMTHTHSDTNLLICGNPFHDYSVGANGGRGQQTQDKDGECSGDSKDGESNGDSKDGESSGDDEDGKGSGDDKDGEGSGDGSDGDEEGEGGESEGGGND
ncbi:hypothetical protein CPB84DRAFT_1842351 [Gymnopilus junonius]|uniref:Uncharacterized protein n=1 Tax=Gymnopilus junonius TaxID=109634 RepID=A0A9P5NYT2_GYMJU|nr:hypothetical protein CPB84DRAFT_1842351 [Gymnopilus junonius]